MAFDEGLAERIRSILDERQGLEEKKMFGGIGFLLRGNMACGVNKDELIVRVGTEKYEDMLSRSHVKVFDMTGRPMKGWVVVNPPGFEDDSDLAFWVGEGVEFALSLPPK